MTRTFWVLLLSTLVFTPFTQAQDLGCGSAVSLNGGTIEVSAASSGDDTENIQCALDAAIDGGYRDVSLVSNEYSIGPIVAKGFVGDLRGVGKSATTVAIQDSSLSCDGQMGVAMQFQVGTASVRSMTISVDSPCGDGGSAAVIAYYSDPAKCSNRATFGNVDRVSITGQGTSGLDVVSGVVMEAAPGCTADNERITGTLKINRADLAGLDFGIITSVAAGGQVDINYNTFEQVGLPLSIIDASQSTTVLYNTINYNDVPGYPAGSGLGTTGVFIASTADSPAKNGTTLKNNTFKDAGIWTDGYGILVGQSDKGIDHKMVVSSNTFQGNSNNTAGSGLAAIDTLDGLVSGNRFSSKAASWIDITSGSTASGYVGRTVSGWAIVANIFNASTATTDIVLGTKTAGNVVGSDQGLPKVDDQTGNNDVLEKASSSFYSFAAKRSGGWDARSLYGEQLNLLNKIRHK